MPNAAELAVVVDILAWRHTEHLSLQQIADRLNARGIRGKRGGRFHPSTIHYILKQSMYAAHGDDLGQCRA